MKRKYLMQSNPEKPGPIGLLRGEGEDLAMICAARFEALVLIFALAFIVFALS